MTVCFQGETVSGILVEVGEGLKAIAPSVELSSERIRKAKMARTLFDMTMKMFLRFNANRPIAPSSGFRV